MIVEQVRTDMLEAMKHGETEKKTTLKMLINALDSKAKDKLAPLTETEELTVVQKEVKQTKESLDSTPKTREDLIKKYSYSLEVLSKYVPEQLSVEDIHSIVKSVLIELGLDKPTIKDKGVIMKSLMPKVKGKADGKLVNDILQSYF